MKLRIEVRTQVEFDACVSVGNIAICIGGGFFMARENSSVEARESSSVVAWENSSVEAWENSSVVARGNVFVRLFAALKIRASAYVTISMQGIAGSIEGGRQLQPAPTPNTGAEWCEYFGIKPDAAFKVENIDAQILTAIRAGQGHLDMSTWHGEKVTEDNWCGTSHCRAGYAVCLAGKAGFELERKYGTETAGKIIYAVSRPDKPLPDFFGSDSATMADLEANAE